MAKKETTRTSKPNVGTLYNLGSAGWGSGVLFAAVRLGVFDILESAPKTTGELAKALKIQKVWAEKLLLALLGLGLVTEAKGDYANSELAAAFLVKGKAAYQGDLMMYFHDMWTRFGEMSHVISNGEPGPRERAENERRSLEEKWVSERAWVLAMHNIAMSGQAEALCKAVDLKEAISLVDVGGGSGTYAVWLARKFPQLRVEVLDSAAIVAIAEEIIEQAGMDNQVTVRAGDFLNDDYGKQNSAVLFSGVLHGFEEKRIARLLKKAYQSLAPGGVVIIQEMLAVRQPHGGLASPFPALFGLNMMSGAAYTAEQVSSWLTAANFTDVLVQPLKGCYWFDHVIVGRKPS
ncbi:MAG: methyltransferase domain-containing protein [Blastocatellia bacterium]|nr:methyltransferase domain-containing protein [Blastocatellia bacterium]